MNNIALNIIKGFTPKYIERTGSPGHYKYKYELENIKEATVFTNLSVLKGEKSNELQEFYYKAKKEGDIFSAQKLISKVFDSPKNIEKLANKVIEIKSKYPKAKILPIYKEEQNSNVIALTFAMHLETLGLEVSLDVSQIKKEKGKTTLNKLQRLNPTNTSEFRGNIIEGSEYILVDDQFTTGGSLNSLRKFIHSKGGIVRDIMTLTRSLGEKTFTPKQELIEELNTKYNNQLVPFLKENKVITESLNELTNGELKTILGPKNKKDYSIEALKTSIFEG